MARCYLNGLISVCKTPTEDLYSQEMIVVAPVKHTDAARFNALLGVWCGIKMWDVGSDGREMAGNEKERRKGKRRGKR
jgi:hypothetical protein